MTSAEGDAGTTVDADAGAPVGPTPSTTRRAARELVIVVVVALVATALLRAFVVQAFFVPSRSMVPTIEVGDRLLVSRLSGLDRGEVVVFEDPGGWLSSQEQPKKPGPIRKVFEFVGVLSNSGHGYLVKRLIGLPGDRVVCCSPTGALVINGHPVAEPYLAQPGGPADNTRFDVVVPAHRIFVLGDNRYLSGDSSRHLDPANPDAAFIPTDLATGRAIAVIWPWSDRKILRIPDGFNKIPPGTPPPPHAIIRQPPGG